MEKILTALGLSTRMTVGISVSSSNIIEIAVVDKNADTIVKYAAKEIKYNNSIRELVNYDEFSMAIIELFEEINVNPTMCNVVLSLPNVYFGFGSIPLSVPDEQVAGAVISDVEQMYLFKRHEPVISWNTISLNSETAKRYIVYGALQETIIRNVTDIFEDIGAKLVALETSNAALIQGIICSGLIEKEITDGSSVNVVLISPNSYSLFCMYGDKLVDYYEEPVAVKSLSADEVYEAISSSISNTMSAHPADSLLVVSEINEVSAEILSGKIRFDGTLKFVERNIYGDKAFMPVSNFVLPKYLPVISLAAAGVASYVYFDYPVKFNFLEQPEEKVSEFLTFSFLGNDYEITRRDILISGVKILAGMIVVTICLCVLMHFSAKITDSNNKVLKEQIKGLSDDINRFSSNKTNVMKFIKKVSDNNKAATNIYTALAEEIPEEVYLTYFSANSDGELIIKGKAPSLEYAREFSSSLKKRFSGLVTEPRLDDAINESDVSQSDISFIIESSYTLQNGQSERTGKLEKELTEKNISESGRMHQSDYSEGVTAPTTDIPAPAANVPSHPPKTPEVEFEETDDINRQALPSVDTLPSGTENVGEELPDPAMPS